MLQLVTLLYIKGHAFLFIVLYNIAFFNAILIDLTLTVLLKPFVTFFYLNVSNKSIIIVE